MWKKSFAPENGGGGSPLPPLFTALYIYIHFFFFLKKKNKCFPNYHSSSIWGVFSNKLVIESKVQNSENTKCHSIGVS